MKIQPLQHSDIEKLKELQPPEWEDISPHIKYYIDSPCCDPIKIMSGKNITGIGTTLKHRDSAWLAHIIVHPEFRNKGIGKMVTNALVKSLDRRKYKTIYLIATELGYPVYLRSGFELEAEYVDFDIVPGKNSFKISGNIIPYEEKYKSEILELDILTTGEDREIRLAGHFPGSFVFLSNGKTAGAYFPKLGEGLIIADSEEAGIELMKFRLQEKNNVVFPKDNKAAFEFCIRENLKFDKYQKRMRLGKKRIWHPENLFNRVSGQIG